jgi:hypothetical protein
MKIAIYIEDSLLVPFGLARDQLLSEIGHAPPIADLIEIHLSGVNIEELLTTVYVSAMQARTELKLPEFSDPHAGPADPQTRIPLPAVPGVA